MLRRRFKRHQKKYKTNVVHTPHGDISVSVTDYEPIPRGEHTPRTLGMFRDLFLSLKRRNMFGKFINDYIPIEGLLYATDADNVIESIENAINEIEVIYYSNALKILSENDPSLQTSLGYAEDMGYSCGDLNSELLATILCQESAREELYNIRDDIEEVIEEWLEDSEDDE